MKRILFFLLLGLVALLTSCSSDPDSYENLLADEKESISKFIERNDITVVSTLPTDSVWPEKLYYRTSDGLYIHIVDKGDTSPSDTVSYARLILSRYYKISLDAIPDTVIRYWEIIDAPYPYTFNYGVEDGYTCDAFHLAAKYMKNNKSVAKLIVPSKLGFEEDNNSVRAYFYDFKIQLTD